MKDRQITVIMMGETLFDPERLKVSCHTNPGARGQPFPVLEIGSATIYPTVGNLRTIRDAIDAWFASEDGRRLAGSEAAPGETLPDGWSHGYDRTKEGLVIGPDRWQAWKSVGGRWIAIDDGCCEATGATRTEAIEAARAIITARAARDTEPVPCPNPGCRKPIKVGGRCWECPACGWHGDTADLEDIREVAEASKAV